MRTRTSSVGFWLPVCAALLLAGCDHADPVAEADNTIEMDASPGVINLGSKPEGKSTITATVKNDKGVPKAGVTVRFKTTAGRMESGNGSVETDAAGEARDVLITGADATVTAKSGPVSADIDVFIGGVNHAPTANFTINPATQIPGGLVTFDGSSSTDPEGNATLATWIWTLTSDNPDSAPTGPAECTGTNPIICTFPTQSSFTKTFTNSQSVAVALQVEDDQGLASSNANTRTLTITGNLPPIANAGGNILTTVNTQVTFDGSLSSDPNPGGAIVRWDWTFGDGNSSLNNGGATTTHTYTAASGATPYQVTLTVWDNGDGTVVCNPANTPPCPNSKTASATITVTVN